MPARSALRVFSFEVPMPVPTTLASLSTTAGSNPPGGGENPFPDLDDHIRAGYAFDAQNRDAIAAKLSASAVSAFGLTLIDDADAATARATLGAVGLTGDQTVAGVKTFSSSPVVPSATTSGQAVNKGQLDSSLSGFAPAAGSASQTFSVAAASASTHAVRLDQFSKSASSQSLPGGVSEKWGYVAIGDVSGVTSGLVTFSSAFPTACRNVAITMRTQSGQNPANFVVSVVDDPAASGFNWVAQELSGAVTNGAGFFWRAIGD